MSTFSEVLGSILSAGGAAGAGGGPVMVRLRGVSVELRPVPAAVEAEIRRAKPKPAPPLEHLGGSNSPKVPIKPGSPAWPAYEAEVGDWFLAFRCAMIAAAKAVADGVLPAPFTDAHAKALCRESAALAGACSFAEIDAAYSALEAIGGDLSPGSLAVAERDLIVRPAPGEKSLDEEGAEMLEARTHGGDGVTLPYVLPPSYAWTSVYYTHRACAMYGVDPEKFFSLSPATRVGMVAFARLSHAEERRAHEELVTAGMVKK